MFFTQLNKTEQVMFVWDCRVVFKAGSGFRGVGGGGKARTPSSSPQSFRRHFWKRFIRKTLKCLLEFRYLFWPPFKELRIRAFPFRNFWIRPCMQGITSQLVNCCFSPQASVLCDIVVLYVLQKKYFYREKKYLLVDDSADDSQVP